MGGTFALILLFTAFIEPGSSALKRQDSPYSSERLSPCFLLQPFTRSSLLSIARNSLALSPRCYRGRL